MFTPSKPREKWQRKRTHVKLRVRGLLVPRPQGSCPIESSREEPILPIRKLSLREGCCLNPHSLRLELLPHLQTGTHTKAT